MQNDKLNSSEKKSILKHGTSLSVLTMISRVLGLLREMTKSAYMGTSSMADSFNVAFLIPNLLRRLFAENSITVAFIPTFKKHLSKTEDAEDYNFRLFFKKNTNDFLSAIFTLLIFFTTTIVILGIIFTPVILRIFFKEKSEDFALTVLLTRIMFPYLFLISIAAFFQGILNGVKMFVPSGCTPIFFNLIIIVFTVFLTPRFGNAAIAMSVGVTVGGVAQMFFQLPFVLQTQFHFSFTSLKKAFTNKGTKTVFNLIIPTLFGMAAYQLNDLFCSALAKNAGAGILSSLQYSMRLQELLLGIFAVSVGTVILPDLAGHATKKNWHEFQKIFLLAMKIIALITIPATFFALLSGEHIINLVYKARSFTSESVALTKSAFNFHILGLFFIALNRIIAPAFYAQGNSKSPAIAGIYSVLVNGVGAAILVKPMKGGGLALALTLASFANTIILFAFLRKNEFLDVGKIIKLMIATVLKMTVFSFVASMPVYFYGEKIYTVFSGHRRIISEGVPLFINFLIFAGIGLVLLFFTGDKSFKTLLRKFKRK